MRSTRWQCAAVTALPTVVLFGAETPVRYRPLGGTIGSYREVFLTLSTHVLAERLAAEALPYDNAAEDEAWAWRCRSVGCAARP